MRDSDENPKIRHFRAGHRYFCQDGIWWFSTREGEEGPFKSREEAEAGLARYVESIKFMKKIKAEQAQKQAEVADKKLDKTLWDRQIDAV
jgi:uncharacterized protein DUF6316